MLAFDDELGELKEVWRGGRVLASIAGGGGFMAIKGVN